jgi:hypothetical protein
VFRFTADGKYVNRFGSKRQPPGLDIKPGQFMFPSCIGIDGQSRIYICDFGGIQVFDSNGTYLDQITFAPGAGAPREVAFNDKNELFVTVSTHRVIKLAIPNSQ